MYTSNKHHSLHYVIVSGRKQVTVPGKSVLQYTALKKFAVCGSRLELASDNPQAVGDGQQWPREN